MGMHDHGGGGASKLAAALGVAGALAVGSLAWAGLEPRYRFSGKVVLVTGGSRGLGLVLARMLAERGARLALLARDPTELDAARDDLEGRGAEVLVLPCDVADAQAVEAAVAEVEAKLGPVDVLVNCAGIIQVSPIEALSLEDLRDAMEIDFWGTVHMTLAVLPRMRARKAGRIVDVTSIGGAVAVPHRLGYAAAKFAAVGFSSGVAAEVAKDGILVTTVLPGLVRTGSYVRALVKGDREKELALFAAGSSLPGLTMSAETAARRILSACERGEGFVTLGLPAKALRVADALAPNLTRKLFATAARFLPGAGGDRPERPASALGSHRPAGSSTVTALSDAAAADNDELTTPTR